MDSRILWQDPAFAYTQELAFMSQHGQVGVVGGINSNMPPILISTDSDEHSFNNAMREARHHPPAIWRGWDIRHLGRAAQRAAEQIKGKQGMSIEIGAIDAVAALQEACSVIDQPILDWLSLRDESDSLLDSAIVAPIINQSLLEWYNEYSVDEVNLALAFRQQMIDEASPVRHQVSIGLYRMNHFPLPRLDKEISYTSLRLYLYLGGIVCSFIFETANGSMFAPFVWTPEGVNTFQIYAQPRAVFASEVMLSCIWRDACVVSERWATRGFRTESIGKHGTSSKPVREKQVVFPRVVYKAQWGAGDSDRQASARLSTQAHTVRGFYRRLGEGQIAHNADERAEKYGYPPPPDSHTFVVPHLRGQGEVDIGQSSIPRIICRGLQVVSVVLS